MSLSVLDQLKEHTIVVADTGDFDSIKQYSPRDATTNPSLILKASKQDEYEALVRDVVHQSKLNGKTDVDQVTDHLLVQFGLSILEVVPGRVSTEVDARLSFDYHRSLEKARTIINLYEEKGISRERILIKLATTWEGVEVSKVLEQEGIHTNMTLLFSLPQAVACALAGSQLISPFVGRIMDWHKKEYGRDFIGIEDPGVKSVIQIFNYYKKFGYPTEVMGASFRNTGEIKELVGCDLLTIGTKFLEEMQNDFSTIEVKLNEKSAMDSPVEKMEMDESIFRFKLNEDAMATEKLAEGIRRFSADMISLEELLKKLITS
ncbi:transaldolase [Opitutales bacterium]|nr:transaldolase [Opitutales bacterium]